MLGIGYVKARPTQHIFCYRGGRLVADGPGLSFFYYAPTALLVSVPIGSQSAPFAFSDTTSDFQEVTIQGQITYRISDPRKAGTMLDFSIHPDGRYRSDDPATLTDRLVQTTQILSRGPVQKTPLRKLLVGGDELAAAVLPGLRTNEAVTMLGVEVLALNVASVTAAPEMAKALQAEARENLLKQADEAIYARRNSSVELERTIKENELKTEIAVEQKKREVRETQMDAELAVGRKKRQVEEEKMAASVALEEQRLAFVERRVANDRKQAEAKAYAIEAMLKPLASVDWRTLLAANGGGNPKSVIALAFQELAQGAGKIGSLNISPDLLSELLKKDE